MKSSNEKNVYNEVLKWSLSFIYNLKNVLSATA